MSLNNRYVRNTRTGVIFGLTPELARNKNCEILPTALCIEYERRCAVSATAVSEMEEELRQHAKISEGDIEAAESVSELVERLSGEVTEAISEVKIVPALSTAGVEIPDDFDLDVDLSSMGRVELNAIAARLHLNFSASIKVGAMRTELQTYLAEAREQTGATSADISGVDLLILNEPAADAIKEEGKDDGTQAIQPPQA